MTDALVVHLNRSTHHAIEPASESFETDGPFVVRVQNHGEGSHIHCTLSGDLASTATVTDDNPFLEPEDVVEIPVEVRTDLRPARGTLELSTGYGREAVEIDVLVRESSKVPTSPIGRASEQSSNSQQSPNSSPTAAGSGATTGDDASESDDANQVPSVESIADAVRNALPRGDAGNALLAVLAVLAIAVALGAWQFVDSVVVTLAVLVVLATVFGAVVALLRTGR